MSVSSSVPSSRETLEALETELLLEGVFRRYGHDFRDWEISRIERRLRRSLGRRGVSSISGLQEKLLRDREVLEAFLLDLSLRASPLFGPPGFHRALRTTVIPFLRTYPFVRVWIAGCSGAEEVHGLAILLMEEGLYDRCEIFATGMSDRVLAGARAGAVPASRWDRYSRAYLRAGGRARLSDYALRDGEAVLFSPDLRKNVVFSSHALETDGVFNQFNLIVCRNALRRFHPRLQARVHDLLHRSLVVFGFLALGRLDALQTSPYEDRYQHVAEALYRKSMP